MSSSFTTVGHGRYRTIAGRVVAVLAAFLVSAGSLVLPATTASASSITFGATSQVDVSGNGEVMAAACTTSTSCVAVGTGAQTYRGIASAMTLPVSSGAPGSEAHTAQAGIFDGVACATATTCVAVGQAYSGSNGVIVPIGATGAIGTGIEVTGTRPFLGIACASTTSCTAVGGAGTQGAFLPIAVATNSITLGLVHSVSGAGNLQSVACPTSATCVAVGNASGVGAVVTITNGTPGAEAPVPGTSALYGVSCWSASNCVAVGSNAAGKGIVVPITTGVPGVVQPVPGTTLLTSVVCASSGSCLAGGTLNLAQGEAVVVTNGIAGAVSSVPGTSTIHGIACNATKCVAVGAVYTTTPDGTYDFGTVTPVTLPSAPQVTSFTTTVGPSTAPWTLDATAELAGVTCPATLSVSIGSASRTRTICTAGHTAPSSIAFPLPVFDTTTTGNDLTPATTPDVQASITGPTPSTSPLATTIIVPSRPVWVGVGDSYSSGHHQDVDAPACLGSAVALFLCGSPGLHSNDAAFSWVTAATTALNTQERVPPSWAMGTQVVAVSGEPASSYKNDQIQAMANALGSHPGSWNVVSVDGGANDAAFENAFISYYESNGPTAAAPWRVANRAQCPATEPVYQSAVSNRSSITTALQGVVTAAKAADTNVRVVDVNYPYVVPSSNPCAADSGGTHGATSTVDALDAAHQAVTGVAHLDLRTMFAPDPLNSLQQTRPYGYPHPTSCGQNAIATAAVASLLGTTPVPSTCLAPPNLPPTARAGPSRTVASGSTSTLNGSSSTDPQRLPLGYDWVQVSGPSATIEDKTAAVTTIKAPSGPATIRIRLIVGNTESLTSTSDIVLTVKAPK